MDRPLFLLAGGFGTRLAQVVADVPKPLAPVHGKPFLSYLIKNYTVQGVTHFVFLIHHLAEKMRGYIELESTNGLLKDAKVDIVEESIPLGTGGSIKNALSALNLKDSFLVSNADTYLSSGIKVVSEMGPSSIGLIYVENVERYGKAEVTGNMIQSFIEKGTVRGSGLINSGLYHLHPTVFDEIEEHKFSIEQTLFPHLVKTNQLKGIHIDADFIDIGIPEDYQKFKDRFEK